MRLIRFSMGFFILFYPQVIYAHTVTVSLKNLVMVVRDDSGKPVDVFPVGIGALNLSGRSLTPVFNGWLLKSNLMLKRTNPAYYKDKAFIRISDAKKGYTSLGIHVTLYKSLRRGFISHGCIQMRNKDLNKLVKLVQKENVRFRVINQPEIDPISYHCTRFNYYVKNFGTKEHPVVKRDIKSHLLILELKTH
jgi:hypothetical protein